MGAVNHTRAVRTTVMGPDANYLSHRMGAGQRLA